MNKKKEKFTTEQKKELSELSGESNVMAPKRYDVPTIKLNGKSDEGLFYRTDVFDKDSVQEKEEVGESFQGTVLKIRRSLVAHTKDSILFTNQHNSWKDNIVLFEASDGKSRMLDKGSVASIREKYQELKVRQILYFLLHPTNEVVKVVVKGKGLSALFDFYKEFSTGEHLFEYLIEIGRAKETGPLGDYYFTTFKKVDLIEDADLVREKIKEVSTQIEETEKYYQQKEEELLKVDGMSKEESDDLKDRVLHPEQEEIDVEDIPY